MRQLALAAILAIVTPNCIAQLNTRIFSYKGTDYLTECPNEVPATPTWHPGSGPCPINPEDAFKLADKHFQKDFGSLKTFQFHDISLSRWTDSTDDRWLYLVSYMQNFSDATPIKLPSGGTQRKPLTIVYYITLDGTVYFPKKKQGEQDAAANP